MKKKLKIVLYLLPMILLFVSCTNALNNILTPSSSKYSNLTLQEYFQKIIQANNDEKKRSDHLSDIKKYYTSFYAAKYPNEYTDLVQFITLIDDLQFELDFKETKVTGNISEVLVYGKRKYFYNGNAKIDEIVEKYILVKSENLDPYGRERWYLYDKHPDLKLKTSNTITKKPVICFQSNRKSSTIDSTVDFEIYVMDIDGSSEIKLTDNSYDDINPSWSYDGNEIIYQSRLSSKYDICVLSADGKGIVRKITSSDANYLNPVFHPFNNSEILYVSDKSGNEEIYHLNLLTNKETRLTNSSKSENYPFFIVEEITNSSDSSNGNDSDGLGDETTEETTTTTTHIISVAFSSKNDGDYDIYKIEPDKFYNIVNGTVEAYGSENWKKISGLNEYSNDNDEIQGYYNKESKQIVYYSNNEAYIINRDEFDSKLPTQILPISYGNSRFTKSSPSIIDNGERIIFSSALPGTAYFDIFVSYTDAVVPLVKNLTVQHNSIDINPKVFTPEEYYSGNFQGTKYTYQDGTKEVSIDINY